MERLEKLKELKAFLENNNYSWELTKHYANYFLKENPSCNCKQSSYLARLNNYYELHKAELN